MPHRDRPVSEIMQTQVAVVAPDEQVDLADDIMSLGHVRHMPVVESGRLVGVLTSHDVLAASLAKVLDFEASHRRSFLRSVNVCEVMSSPVATLRPQDTIREAGEKMVKQQISCLPVVDEGETLIGLVTVTDLVKAALLYDDFENEWEVKPVTDVGERIEREFDELRRVRDELRVRMHLAKAEVRDRWETLEEKLETLESHARRIQKSVEEPLEEVNAAAHLLVDELKEGYRRIKQAL